MPLLSFSQAEQLLKDKEFDESTLINALTPMEEKPMCPPDMPKCRTFRMDPRPVKQASASLLITFETDSAKLTLKAKQSLETVARALKSDKLANFKFSIEGHADPRGGEDLNLRLSQERAESVVSYLAEYQKIDRSRLQAVGKGQSELLNIAEPSAPENRRVTIKTMTE
jgi:outer membrane protein OmpA-like peptidoglycan-associated protein